MSLTVSRQTGKEYSPMTCTMFINCKSWQQKHFHSDSCDSVCNFAGAKPIMGRLFTG